MSLRLNKPLFFDADGGRVAERGPDRAAKKTGAGARGVDDRARRLTTSLDQAIGDGDHGLNMKRGFEAVLATLPGLADKSLPEMLKAIGVASGS